ncbi:YSC84-related protein [Comamonas sp.]|uniref:BPSL1445 family SYLF domain-containing lipoprotein n=1 Tax=Comamonas sp. TaxID=34028 RepID=UPI0028A0C1E1|nr:YSC84-related protein [Comamonas sp.]
MQRFSMRTLGVAAAVVAGALSMAACTVTKPETSNAPRADETSVDARANAALERLYQTAPGSKDLVARSKGVLVFPSVIGGSFVIGVEHGRGVLRVANRSDSYYSTTGASIGWQAGGQSKAVIYVFNTPEALAKFRDSNGWSVGADATVAAGRIGANGSIDTTSAQAPVTSFVLNNAGLEAGVSLQGAKITKIKE